MEAHIQTGHELIRAQSDTAGRARAASALAEAQLLAGRLLFFDLQSPEAARGRFWEALESAEDGNDPLLPGVILGHASFTPGFAVKLPDAMGFLAMAERRLRSHELSPIRGWLESVRAEVSAIGGDVEASRAAMAKADQFLDRGGRVPRWFDWFNEPRLGSFAGYCLLRSAEALPKGATERSRLAVEARDGLLRALRGLDGTFAAKQQGVVLADLARAHAELGDMPQACSTLSAAGAAVRVTGYAMARQRVRVVHDALRQRWGREPMVRGLDDLLPI